MIIEKAIEEFRKGALQVDFTKITIQQRGGAGARIVGGGSASQGNDGRISIKCYGVSDGEHDRLDSINRDMNRVPGELYADFDYYDLTAIDIGSQVWTVKPTLINRNWSLPQDAGTVEAKGIALEQERQLKLNKNLLRLIFFEQEHKEWEALYCSRRDINLDDTGLTISLTIESERDDQIAVTIDAAGPLPPAFALRVVEALQFVLAQTLHVALLHEIRGNKETARFNSAPARTLHSNAYPPLETRHGHRRDDVINLFALYLDFVAPWPEEGYWHACSNFLTLARNSSGLSLDAWAVGLSVAIEGVAGLIEFNPDPGSPAKHANVRKAITKLFDEMDTDPSIKKRILGMIAQLDMVRARDRMESLVSTGHLLRTDIKVWQSLRNSSVHTKNVTAADFSSEKIQKELDRVHTALRLLNITVFHLIGYRGPFTDYAARGFPESRYPFPEQHDKSDSAVL